MKAHSSHRLLVTLYWFLGAALLPLIAWQQTYAFAWQDVKLLAVLLAVATFKESFPLFIRGSMIVSLTFTIYLIAFVCFGLVPEVVLSQCVLLIAGITVYRYRGFERIFANSAMFMLASEAGAFCFRLAGGHVGSFDSEHVIPYVVFYCAYFIVNHLILWTYLAIRGDFRIKSYLRGAAVDFITSSFAALLALVSLYAYFEFSKISLYLILIPLLGVAYVFRLYNELAQANQQMAILSRIGTKFTAELQIDRSLDVMLDELSKLIEYSSCSVYLYNQETRILEPIAVKAYSADFEQEMWDIKIPLGFGPTGYAALIGEPVLVTKNRKSVPWADFYHPYLDGMESLIAVPLIWENSIIGVVTFANFEKSAYHKSHVSLLTVLANQAAVAIHNARRFQSSERRSQIDELTGLVNYRHFDHLLHEEFRMAETEGSPLTFVVIDIDHFKQVNDTFGHLAGNEVLRTLAAKIQAFTHEYLGTRSIVARYGGEEFTLLLPGTDENTGYFVCESIRSLVENTFIRVPTINGDVQTIRVTVSVGLATYPNQADSPVTLMRHADRAMYYGSKQAGRNRVASYQHV